MRLARREEEVAVLAPAAAPPTATPAARPRRRRRGVRALAAAVVVLLVAGIVTAVTRDGEDDDGGEGGEGGSQDATELAARAAQAAREAGTARFVVRRTSAGAAAPAETASGVLELAGPRADFTLAFPRADGSTVPVRALTDGTTFFVQVPDDRRSVTEDKPWIAAQGGPEALGPVGSCPQAAYLDGLGRLGEEVEVAGSSGTLGRRGEDAGFSFDRQIRASVPLERLSEVVPEGCRAGLQGLEDRGVSSISLEEYLDGGGRPLLVRISFGAGSTLTQVQELTEFGAPLEIVPPPPDQTLQGGDLAAVAQRLR